MPTSARVRIWSLDEAYHINNEHFGVRVQEISTIPAGGLNMSDTFMTVGDARRWAVNVLTGYFDWQFSVAARAVGAAIDEMLEDPSKKELLDKINESITRHPQQREQRTLPPSISEE